MVARVRGYALGGALAVLLSMIAVSAGAAVPVHVVTTDLRPLIRAALGSPDQFAVSVPHTASTASDGTWTIAGDTATWSYAVQIPTAVSLSFHAIHAAFPKNAILVVRGAKTQSSYRGSSLHRGELWSRIYPGDALEFTLTVATADRGAVSFEITSLQAGYRSLGPGVSDHPYYRELLRAREGASANLSCVTNYECEVSASNTPAGAATVAIIVGNVSQCSGVLLNDVPEDNTPYVVTARHCETGVYGGGNPGAASSVTVYWDATTPCGAALGSIYDGNLPTQTGAQTMVEQQDAWLIKLDGSPVVSDAQFAGFDASGAAIEGGYTIHHAAGYDKQFTEWFGQAAAVEASDVLGSAYVSNFWETVNQLGNVAPGASGSGLFDQNNHFVGHLSLGRQTDDPSGYGSCPAPSPPVPNGINGVADFTALSAIWNSTADSTSKTGSATFQSVLDPGGTGTMVVPSVAAAAISFVPFNTDIFFVGTPEVIQWSAANATSCAASGGESGDGWSGTLPISGSQTVDESSAGPVTYTLTCQFSGGRTASASESFQWVTQATAQLNTPYVTWAGAPATLSWSSNVSPCAISGGALSLTNLPASGSTTTTQAAAGDVNYTLTCGPANNSAGGTYLVQYVTPSVTFAANGTDRLLGQKFFLEWITQADSCVPSGGAPNDGWATAALPRYGDAETFSPNVTSAGTYTYTLTCSSGAISVQQSVTVTFENSAPYVTASLSPTAVTFSNSPADYATVTWNSNLSTCDIASNPNLLFPSSPSPPFDISTPFGTAPLPQGTQTAAPPQSGTYVITVTCTVDALNGLSVTSAPMMLTVNPAPAPTAAISFTPSSVLAGQSFTVAWTSTNALNCTQTGDVPDSDWGEPPQPQPATGSMTVTTAQAGNFTFGLSCPSIDAAQSPATAQASLSIQALSETLSPANTAVTVGSPFTLTWSSTAATSCTASGGGANGTSWSGAVATSGTLTQTATTPGMFTYTLTCGADGQVVTQEADISVSAASSSSSSSSTSAGSGGHGGGGSIGLLELAVLTTVTVVAGRPRRSDRRAIRPVADAR